MSVGGGEQVPTGTEAVEQQLRGYLRRVTVELAEERARLDAYRHEPIAIVGIACRYPGGVGGPEELWELVATGSEGIAELPGDRGWDLERLAGPDQDRGGTSHVWKGGFIEDPGGFDAQFFGISPGEARLSDPQHRLMLEACWEALEDARLDPASLHGSKTGVFAGAMYQDYGILGGSPGAEGYLAAIGSGSAVSGRVAYQLGLEGPAISIDTACSSSLVALHVASRALRGGECSLALAGGVTVMSTPVAFEEFARQSALAPDGRCKSFADAANGTGMAEGVGVLVLERLSDAQRNGRRILATIRGSAVNQDGASNGFSAPNGPSQERVIRQALASAGLTPQDVDAVEAHGTGTALGDPIEAGALLAVYGQDRESPLRLGSIKSNIGHTQAAAGVAGVIKMTLAMREGLLPKTLHVDAPSSKIDWESGEIELLAEAVGWEPSGRRRRAGVSSFGVSGTNAHLILEEAPPPSAEEADSRTDTPGASAKAPLLPRSSPLLLSAKSEAALKEGAQRLASHLQRDPELDPTDVAYSLATTRTTMEHRAVVLGRDRGQLLEGLEAVGSGRGVSEEQGGRLARGHCRLERAPVFVFPGHGSQWVGMARELLDSSPAFACHFRSCEEAFAPFVECSLADLLRDSDDWWLRRVDVLQPALFTMMVSLARLWEELGVRPAAVVGHSQGEIAAAHVAGGLSLEHAAQLVAVRSKLLGKLAGQGGGISVSLSAEEIAPRLERWEGRAEIAALNGPRATLVAGDPETLTELQRVWGEEGIRVKDLGRLAPAHCAQIEVLRDELLETLAPISAGTSEIPFHSTVTGEVFDTAGLDVAYWYDNMRKPVLFEPTIRGMLEAGRRIFIEVSPHPLFAMMLDQTIEHTLAKPSEATVLGTLRRGEGGPERFALALAEAHVAGVRLDWEAFFGDGARRVGLPTYPFQRKRYWLDFRASSGSPAMIGQADPEHPLLGAATSLASEDRHLLTGRLSLHSHPWLADHAIAGTAVLPAAVFVELALRAGAEAGAETIEELALREPVVLPDRDAVQVQVSVSRADERGARAIEIHSRGEGDEMAEWRLNAEGTVVPGPVAPPRRSSQWPPSGAEPLDPESFYDRLSELGIDFGPGFQGVQAAWGRGDEMFAELSLAVEQIEAAAQFGLHPGLLEPALQLGLLAGEGSADDGPRLPAAFTGVSLYAEGASELRAEVQVEKAGFGLCLSDGDGTVVAELGSVRPQPFSPPAASADGAAELYAVKWDAIALRAEDLDEEPDSDALILRDTDTEGDTVRDALLAVREWVASESSSNRRLAFVTRNAVVAKEGEDPSPPSAAIWGLVRAAQAEHPDRFLLIDTDGSEASERAVSAVLASGHSQAALREGQALAPRLVPTGRKRAGHRPGIDPDRTVFVGAGCSGAGARVARHLVAEHGVRHLLLADSAAKTGDAGSLVEELGAAGAEVLVEAWEPGDRDRLEELIASIPPERSLAAVFHCGRMPDAAVVESIDPERLESAMRATADAAQHLHELTEDLDLSHFVLFSSAVGTIGLPAQASAGATSAFLDALAAHRRSKGLPATSLAWGWTEITEAGAETDDPLRARLRRLGFAPIDGSTSLAVLDDVLAREEPLLASVAFDRASLRERAREGTLPPALWGLVRLPTRRERSSLSLAHRLAGLPAAEREEAVLDLVRTHAAAVLGLADSEEVEPSRSFSDLGFESLGAVELRNRLGAATGVRLAPTVVFDYPSAEALAQHLLATADADRVSGESGIEVALAKLEAAVAATTAEDGSRGMLKSRLEAMLDLLAAPGSEAEESIEELASMSDDDVFALIDQEIEGVS